MPEPPGGRAVAGPAGSVASHPQLPSQPSLNLLPPYIQAEAQLRSQRYWGGLWRNPRGRGSPLGRVPTCGSPQGLGQAADPGTPD